MATETATKTLWVIDPMHSEVQFKIKHLVISTVTGAFKAFEGQAETDGDTWDGAHINFSVDVASIDTNQEQRDAHLRSADFFDAEGHPKITFNSTRFEKAGPESYKLHGELTVKGVTKPVELQAEFGGAAADMYGQSKVGFEVTGKINRQDYGLTWSAVTEAGGLVVGDEVRLTANIQLVRK